MAKLIINPNRQRNEFISFVTRLANKYGNRVTDNPVLRKLEVELANDILDHSITLAEAEEIYLRSSGLTTFNIDQIEL